MIRFQFLLLLAISAAILGCGGDGGAAVLKRRSNLGEIGKSYLGYFETNQRAPTSAAELAEFMQDQAAGDSKVADAITALQEGDVTVIWNGNLGGDGSAASYVLAFEAGVPATGGYVVMADGQVKLMTGKDYSEATMLPAP